MNNTTDSSSLGTRRQRSPSSDPKDVTADAPDGKRPRLAISSGIEVESRTVASAPFDKSDADVIFRTSDNIDFFTYKKILTLASPVFEDMFSVPQPTSTISAQDVHSDCGVSVIAITEDGQTLDHLLRWCYPGANPIIRTIAELVNILEAARKYQMEDVTAWVSQAPLLPFIKSDPMASYAVACQYELKDVARTAARAARIDRDRSSGFMAETSHVKYVPEMDCMSAGALYRLLQFCYSNTPVFRFTPKRSATPASKLSPSHSVDNPFDHPSENSDTVLQSSDGVRFHVHSLLLKLASPVFSQMISHPPDGDSLMSDDGRVFTVSEECRLLSVILQLCYPIPSPRSTDCALQDIVHAARKYKITRMIDFAQQKLLMTVETDALQAYLIAVREGWDKEAKEAAIHSVYQRHDVYVPEMEEVSAKEYHRLLVYRHKSVKVISKILFPGGNNLVAMDSAIDQQDWRTSTFFVEDAGNTSARDYDTTQTRFSMLSLAGLHLPSTGTLAPSAVLRKFRGDWTLRRKEFAEAIQESEQSASQIKYALSQVKL